MKRRNHDYPDDLHALLQKAEKTAEQIRAKLNHAPKLEDLFTVRANGKRYKHNDYYQLLKVKANVANGTKSLNDICGLYAFGTDENKSSPVYIGISRSVNKRLRQHGWGAGHNDASFAYLMAKDELNYEGDRKDMPIETLITFQKRIHPLRVAVIPIEDAYELYFTEVAVAALLKTPWNSFETH